MNIWNSRDASSDLNGKSYAMAAIPTPRVILVDPRARAARLKHHGPGPLITMFSPTGRVLETHVVPAIRPTNCCFGGPDMTTLFVTSTQGHFFKAETKRVGWAMWP